MVSKKVPTASPPDPWPQEPRSDGALYGSLPLKVPRTISTSSHVTILSRQDGVTTFSARQDGKQHVVVAKIDTVNEKFLCMVTLSRSLDHDQLHMGGMDPGRAVALQGPPTPHPSRNCADHADGDPLNNTGANMHWTTSSFNNFNRRKKKDSDGFVRIRKRDNRFTPYIAGIGQGSYRTAQTAALAYNLVCRHIFGDQLDKTPHLFNPVPNEASRSVMVAERPTGAVIHRIDDEYVVYYDGRIQPKGQFASLQAAKTGADKIVAKLAAKKAADEKKWQDKAAKLEVTDKDRDDGKAFLCTSGGVKVYVRDDTWKIVKAKGATIWLANVRACVRVDGKTRDLARWIKNAVPGDVVDHKNGEKLDNRLENLRITDYSGNAQNVRRGGGYINVLQCLGVDDWTAKITVKGTSRIASKRCGPLEKAVEFHDLAAVYQHGRGALLNEPTKVQEYVDMLETDAIKKRVKDFLEKVPKRAPFYRGVQQRGDLWTGLCCVGEGKKRKTSCRSFKDSGGEVKAAIYWDLWRLKTKGTDFTVNFEFMRPWYLHYLDCLVRENDLEIIALAYKRMGGDGFRDIRKKVLDTESEEGNAVAGSSSNVFGKRKFR